MMRSKFGRGGVAIVMGLAVGAFAAGAEEEKEERIAVDALPPAVTKTVKEKFPKAGIAGASKETEDGKTTYEVELLEDKKEIDVSVDADGKILEVERMIAVADLPAAVRDAVKAKYPKAEIEEAEEVTKAETKSYEVIVEVEDDKERELSIDPAGKILKDEAEDEDD